MFIQSKFEIHSVICYLVWKEKPPVEVYNAVKTVYGNKAMNRTSVYKWYVHLKMVIRVCMTVKEAKDLQL